MNAVVCAGFGEREQNVFSRKCRVLEAPPPQLRRLSTALNQNNKSAHVNTSSNWSHWVFEGLFTARKLRPSSVPEHTKTLEQEATQGKMLHALFITFNKGSAFRLGLNQV